MFHFDRDRSRFGFFYSIRNHINWYLWPQKWPSFWGNNCFAIIFRGIFWWPLKAFFFTNLLQNFWKIQRCVILALKHNFFGEIRQKSQKISLKKYLKYPILRIQYLILFDTMKNFEISWLDQYSQPWLGCPECAGLYWNHPESAFFRCGAVAIMSHYCCKFCGSVSITEPQ